MIFRLALLISIFGLLSACLKTRADLGEQEQSQVYGKKNADNQAVAKASQLSTKAQPQPAVDDRDELIRGFNGRIESLENQITNLQKEKEKTAAAGASEAQKNQALQESLTKMEAQIQKLEADTAAQKAIPVVAPSHQLTGSDANGVKPTGGKADKSKKDASRANEYELAQGHFAKKEWKKAILSYQKYVDENSKGTNVADSKYKIGVCFQELGMKEESMAFYEEVIANFGKTESGKKAKIRLAKLKK
ncbi:MAG: tetratricopeptide repeat protein [Pseudobdellovibrio sp.]